MTPCLGGSQFNMKNPLNLDRSPLNSDPTGRNSMGSKFNLTPAFNCTCSYPIYFVWWAFFPPQTEFFLYVRSNSQCCLPLVVLIYPGKDSFASVNNLWRHESYIDMTSWLTNFLKFASFSYQKSFCSSFWKQK